MNSHLFSSSPFLSLVCFLLVVFTEIQSSSSNPNYMYESCNIEFKCGNITADYPFSKEREFPLELPPLSCGHPELKLNCEAGDVATMRINEVKYRVLDIKRTDKTLRIARMDYMKPERICSPAFHNTTINREILDYSDGYENLTFIYDCTPPKFIPCSIIKGKENMTWSLEAGYDDPRNCDGSVFFPVPKNISLLHATIDDAFWRQVLDQGFELKWKQLIGISCEECTKSKGSCGWNSDRNETICFCPNQPNQPFGTTNACRPGNGKLSHGAVAGIAIGSAVAGIFVVVFVLVTCMCLKNCLSCKLMFFWQEQTLNDRDVEALVKTYGSLAPKRYNYSDIKKMTNSFAFKLGQGGYGVVYRGKLNDGRIVAVKVLSKSEGNGEEFINEVACISRTSHVNIVGLLGFCFKGTRRALIYEFMPNGSLDKFINQGSLNTNLHLEWETLNQIVIGVARGLEYLHRGCNIRIVHFDIKPHNVLLDEDFCPKISDFGLAKICKKKESMISMLDARGTIGYIAPEVFCRNFGGVSHKSDVYGFGMMVLEMVGVRQRTAGDHGSNTSETYFPEWIYKQIEGSNNLTVDGIINEEEEAIARKMILVSLWCIQTNPSERPSMSKVVEMLEGSVQSLQVPPKPFLQHSSPRSFQLYSSTTSTSLSRIS